MRTDISIIMPAFNEANCIYENIRETREAMHRIDIDPEIVVVDDGSTDETCNEVGRAAEENTRTLLAAHEKNMGKGFALRTGFEHTTGEVIVFLDADLDIHPSEIQHLLATLEDRPCDIVVSSKHHPESELDYPWTRTIASLIYYVLIKVMFGLPVKDTQTGLKVFRREPLESVLPRMLVKQFAYDVELLAVAVHSGFRVCEVPIKLQFRRQMRWGRIRFEDVFKLFWDTMAVFYRLRILKYYDKLS